MIPMTGSIAMTSLRGGSVGLTEGDLGPLRSRIAGPILRAGDAD
jgi:hypothetical protein